MSKTIKKGMVASELDIYNRIMERGIINPIIGGTYFEMVDGKLIWFIIIPKIRKEEKEEFSYRTKHFGYITNDEGHITLIADNLLATEANFYPYPIYKEQIKRGIGKDVTVVLIDNVKNEVIDIKVLLLPDVVKKKLEEQWLLSLENEISFGEYQYWMGTEILNKSCKDNVRRAKDFEKVEEIKANEIVITM